MTLWSTFASTTHTSCQKPLYHSAVTQTYRKLAHYALELIPEGLRLVSVRTVELFNLAVKDGDVSGVERLAKSWIPLSVVSDAVNRLAIEDGADARILPSLRALEQRLLIAELREQVCEAAKSGEVIAIDEVASKFPDAWEASNLEAVEARQAESVRCLLGHGIPSRTCATDGPCR
jgi:hypothetical protein